MHVGVEVEPTNFEAICVGTRIYSPVLNQKTKSYLVFLNKRKECGI